jgi:glycosyltransferase involved in cell wall biosynthesis
MPRCEYVVQDLWPASRPLVSVIIPCYNYGTYLRGAIDSVLAQTLTRYEIIVIDDGSTDEFTRTTLATLDCGRTRVIRQQNNGLAETRNIGATLADGKYICFLDADDMIAPTYLERTVTILEGDESLGTCYSWVQCFGDRASIWQTEDMEPFILKEYTTASSHGVIRKKAWEAVRRRNGSGYLSKYDGYFEDWVFWIDMIQCGYRGTVITEPLILYRVHKDSLGATHKPGFRRMFEVLTEDRKEFFSDSSYRRRLEHRLHRRRYVQNRLLNIIDDRSEQGPCSNDSGHGETNHVELVSQEPPACQGTV